METATGNFCFVSKGAGLRLREQTCGVHAAMFKMDNQQGPTVQHRELCSMLCGSLDGRGAWGKQIQA